MSDTKESLILHVLRKLSGIIQFAFRLYCIIIQRHVGNPQIPPTGQKQRREGTGHDNRTPLEGNPSPDGSDQLEIQPQVATYY